MTGTCTNCGQTFEQKPRQVRRCCSKKCASTRMGAVQTKKAMRVCVGCGVTFKKTTSASKGMYCSRRCAFAHYKEWRVFRAKKVIASVEKQATERACLECGAMFSATVARKVICGPQCATKRYVRIRAGRKHILPKTLICKHCNTSFQLVYGNKRRTYCSDVCASRHERQVSGGSNVQRAKKAGVARVYGISWQKVCARDGWRCQLCGCATPKRLRGTYKPNAPEIDHIVPMGAGGGHTWDNVQCSCRQCNSNKGAKPLGQQRLIA
jgi:5-methylcytosine-specific restriction endonuclease McrA